MVVEVEIPAALYNEQELKGAILAVLWVRDFIDECAAFPNAKHDDHVDALTMALAWMSGLSPLSRHNA
jgi:phage terminase large subunit-like protein